MEQEAFEARIHAFVEETRKLEPGCTIMIFSARAASREPHSPIGVVMRGDDAKSSLGVLQVGHDMAKVLIYGTLGLNPDGTSKPKS